MKEEWVGEAQNLWATVNCYSFSSGWRHGRDEGAARVDELRISGSLFTEDCHGRPQAGMVDSPLLRISRFLIPCMACGSHSISYNSGSDCNAFLSREMSLKDNGHERDLDYVFL